MSGHLESKSNSDTSPPASLFRHRGLWLAATMVAVYVALVPLHTQDGANHRQVAVLLERLISADVQDPVYQSNLGLLRTNVLFSGGYALAAAKIGIPIHLYERLFVSGFLILLLVGYRRFLAEWTPGRTDLWVWILPITMHALFVTGMYNFLAATALTLPLLTYLKRLAERPSAKTLAAMSALAWLAFLAHPFPFFVLPAAWLWLVTGRTERPGAFMWSGGGVLVGLLFLGFALPMVASAVPQNPYVFKPPLELLAGLVYYNFPLFSSWAVVAAVPVLVCAIAMAWMSLQNADLRNPYRRGMLLWLGMLLAYFLFPSEGHGGAHLNERFLPFVWIFLPLGLAGVGEGSVSSRRWIRGTAVASTILMAAALWAGLGRVDREVRDAAAVLAELPDEARLYPLEFDPGGNSLAQGPLLHLWANHATDRTVHSPFSFTFMDLMSVSRRLPSSDTYFPAAPENHAQVLAEGRFCRPRDPVSTSNCGLQEQDAWDELLSAAQYYDHWFVHGAPQRWRQAISEVPGLTLVAEVGRASVWRYDRSREFSPKLLRRRSAR